MAEGRSCVFCGATEQLTAEDTPAQWISRTIADFMVVQGWTTAKHPFRADESHGRHHRKLLGLKGRLVCHDCNTQWMSRMETDVKPILGPMLTLADGQVTLSTEDQEVLSRWAFKTALTADVTMPRSPGMPREVDLPANYFHDFYKYQRPPDNAVILLAARVPDKPFAMWPAAGIRDGLVLSRTITFSVSFAVFQVWIVHPSLGPPPNQLGPAIADQILPPTGNTIRFPNGGLLANQDAVEFFASAKGKDMRARPFPEGG